MVLRVEIKPPELPDILKGPLAKSIIKQESIRAVNESTIKIRDRMIEVSPVALGTLRGSWITVPARTKVGGVEGSTLTSQAQGIIIDEGARPHRPPPQNLEPWIRRKLGISGIKEVKKAAFLVSRKISRRGLPARQLFSRAVKRLRKTLTRIQENMIRRVVKRLDKG